MIRLLLKKAGAFFVTEVPIDIAACEFDCRKENCLNKDFQNCPRRQKKAQALKNYLEKHQIKN